MLDLSLADLIKIIPAVLVGLTVHEFAHSFVAIMLGDDTPRQQGRLTLNPFRHIELVGFIFLIIAGFGWAKPVRIDRDKLKHPRRDDILISLAGPLSNFLFALLLVFALKLSLTLITFHSRYTLQTVYSVFGVFIGINLGLAVFNLLPIPPLDGSHLIYNLISLKSYEVSAKYFKYGSFVLLLLIVLDRFTNIDLIPLGKVIGSVMKFLFRVAGII